MILQPGRLGSLGPIRSFEARDGVARAKARRDGGDGGPIPGVIDGSARYSPGDAKLWGEPPLYGVSMNGSNTAIPNQVLLGDNNNMYRYIVIQKMRMRAAVGMGYDV